MSNHRESCEVLGNSTKSWIFIFSLLLIIVYKSSQWREPPFWDAAFSVFPAAITLAETNFDYVRMYHAPRYADGGPNVHACSLVTLITALTWEVTPDAETALLVLHFLHYIVAAATVSAFYSWSLPILGSVGAVATGTATLFFPLFMTQAGHMYLEMPMAFAILKTIDCYRTGKLIRASVWAATAVFIKEPGIIAAGTIGLAALTSPGALPKRLLATLGLITPAIAVTIALLIFYSSSEESTIVSMHTYISTVFYYLKHIPDLLALVIASGVLTILGIVRSAFRRILRRANHIPDDEARSRRMINQLLIAMFFSCYLTLAWTGWTATLPRYFIAIFPFMFLIVADCVRTWMGPRALLTLALLSVSVSIVNRDGRFYPYIPGNSGSNAERSGEYTDLITVQMTVMRAAEAVPSHIPIFHGLPEHYFNSYPSMGYVKLSLPNMIGIPFSPRYSTASLEEFPDHFYIIISYWSLGGEKLNSLKAQADADKSYKTKTNAFQCGSYQARLIEIQRLAPDKPEPR